MNRNPERGKSRPTNDRSQHLADHENAQLIETIRDKNGVVIFKNILLRNVLSSLVVFFIS